MIYRDFADYWLCCVTDKSMERIYMKQSQIININIYYTRHSYLITKFLKALA